MQGYNWGQHSGRTLMDVGGGVGGVLSAILHQVPSMRGVLFERWAPLPERGRPARPPAFNACVCLPIICCLARPAPRLKG